MISRFKSVQATWERKSFLRQSAVHCGQNSGRCHKPLIFIIFLITFVEIFIAYPIFFGTIHSPWRQILNIIDSFPADSRQPAVDPKSAAGPSWNRRLPSLLTSTLSPFALSRLRSLLYAVCSLCFLPVCSWLWVFCIPCFLPLSLSCSFCILLSLSVWLFLWLVCVVLVCFCTSTFWVWSYAQTKNRYQLVEESVVLRGKSQSNDKW